MWRVSSNPASGKRNSRERQPSSGGSSQTTKRSSKLPAKYSRQNSQNREVVAKSKDEATISSIGLELASENEDLGSGTDSDFNFNPFEYEDFGCSSMLLDMDPKDVNSDTDSDSEFDISEYENFGYSSVVLGGGVSPL